MTCQNNRSQDQKQNREARYQASCDKAAMMAADADAQTEGKVFRKATPRVYRKGEAEEGTAKVGMLKGKDLEKLKARLANRSFGR